MAKSKTVSANKKPHGVSGLAAPSRDNYKFTAKWTKPSTTKTDARRAKSQNTQWRKCILAKGKKGEKSPGKILHRYRALTKVKKVNVSKNSSSVSLKRSDYYPCKKKDGSRHAMLHKVMIRVRNRNTKKGNWSEKEYVFVKPDKPSITIEYDESVNEVVMTVNSSVTNEKKERYDTVVKGERKDTGDTGSDRQYQTKWLDLVIETGEELSDKEFKGDSKAYSHRITNPILPQGADIHMKVSAHCRGFMGDSDTTTEHYIIRPPYIPEIKKIRVITGGSEITGKMSASQRRKYLSSGNGQVFVDFGYANRADTSDETANYDKVRTLFTLQRLVSEEWQDQPEWAASSSGWVDNVDTYEGATSDRIKGKSTSDDWATMGEPSIDVVNDMGDHIYGHHVWYRIKAYRQGMSAYSEPVEASAFAIPTPSAKNDKSGFIYLENGSDGQTINTVVGWDDPNDPNEMYDDPEYKARGEWTTVIGYSEYKDAIQSNRQPEEIVIDWGNTGNYSNYESKDVNTGDKKIKWNETAECTIHGLECGVPYYLWVKRHVEMDGLKESDKNSKWNSAPEGYFPFTPTDNPTSINVSTPMTFIPTSDNSLRVSWTHNAVSPQKHWAVFALALPENYSDLIGNNTSTGNAYLLAEKIPCKILASGEGAADSATITYNQLISALTEYQVKVNGQTFKYGSLSNGDTLYIGVGVSTGGAMALSYATAVGAFAGANAVTVAVAPDCGIYVDPIIKSQPITAYIFTNDSTSLFTMVAKSRGASVHYPDGDYDQGDGDYVWSHAGKATEWVTTSGRTDLPSMASEWSFVAILKTEGTLEFLQNGMYDFEAITVNMYSNLLVSPTATAVSTVNYTREAYPAGPTSRCETRNAGSVNPYVEIYAAKPSNWVDTDHAIIYRVTPDKAYAIATDVRFGTVVTDYYPPFSKVADTRYAIATVTSDGMVAIREVPYSLKRHGLRFDWGDGRYLELPYNLTLSDDFEKDSEIRAHQDGTVNAYWNPAVTRTMSASTAIIKQVEIYDVETFELVREMGQYPGPVLVRAHNGVCFMANVQVSGLSDSYEELIAPVNISCTEITLMEQFMSRDYYKYNVTTVESTETED